MGGKVKLNVYRDDAPMFQCHTPEQAAEVVALLNRGERASVYTTKDAVKINNLLCDALESLRQSGEGIDLGAAQSKIFDAQILIGNLFTQVKR